MIHHLRGRIAHKEAGFCVVEVHGVGYQLAVPASTLTVLPAVGQDVTLYTRLLVREDDVSLFGFATLEERHLFNQLLSVASIGPKLALAVLGLGVESLRRAVATGDDALLQSVPGVGKKTAQRIVLELRDKLGAHEETTARADGATPPADPYREAAAALVALGYGPAEAAQAAASVRLDGAEPDVATIVREALKRLASGIA
ncbi:MAG: Holliday junction branch migration protein RuvA [Clostridia bacterium]|nr:Holliday junction branch migration protein RuvA [Clostridia bacterium]